jgi:hypothetical protein
MFVGHGPFVAHGEFWQKRTLFAKLAEAPISCSYKITSQKKKKKTLRLSRKPQKTTF